MTILECQFRNTKPMKKVRRKELATVNVRHARIITLRASDAAAQCILIAPVCVFVCLFVCGSALLQPARSVCVASERFFR